VSRVVENHGAGDLHPGSMGELGFLLRRIERARPALRTLAGSAGAGPARGDAGCGGRAAAELAVRAPVRTLPDARSRLPDARAAAPGIAAPLAPRPRPAAGERARRRRAGHGSPCLPAGGPPPRDAQGTASPARARLRR